MISFPLCKTCHDMDINLCLYLLSYFQSALGSNWSLPSTQKMGTELVLETSEHFNILAGLLARENFIERITFPSFKYDMSWWKQNSTGTTIAEAVKVQHICIVGICTDVQHFSQHTYSATISGHSSRLTLLTDSHGAVRREGRTVSGAKVKLLYSQVALCRKISK